MIGENILNRVWEGCLNNDRKQEELLYRLLSPRMLAVCMRYAHDRDEAQDILQEGFIKIFRNRNHYRGEGSLEGWVRRIMIHSAISRYRRQRPVILQGDMLEPGTASQAYEFTSREVKDLLKMIQQLPDTYRSVFNLYAIEGYSHQEIGNKLGMTELLSRTTLHRARAILKNKLAKLDMAGAQRMAG